MPNLRLSSNNAQEQARNAYMKHGAYQIEMDEYPLDDSVVHQRKFQYHWFKSFPWLEYSPLKDAVYCFPCFLFIRSHLEKKGLMCLQCKDSENGSELMMETNAHS